MMLNLLSKLKSPIENYLATSADMVAPASIHCNFVLVEFFVHKDVHGIGKVRVGALFLVQNNLVHFVVGFKDNLGAHVAQQSFELHANSGSAATASAVFGAQNDHGIFALHDDVTDANFLSYFHKVSNVFPKHTILALFCHKLKQLTDQICLFHQSLAGILDTCLPCQQVDFWQGNLGKAVPCHVKLTQTLGCF